MKGKQKTLWTKGDHDVALNLHLISPRALDYVRDSKSPLYLPLPSNRTVLKQIEHLECLPGIIHESMTDLSCKSEHLGDIDRVCIIMFDEMKISELYDYHGKSDSVFGGHRFVQMVMA